MDTISLTKQQAADLFGGKFVDLAAAVGVSRQAINAWPEKLTARQTDFVVGAAIRLGRVSGIDDLAKRLASTGASVSAAEKAA